LGSHDEFGFTDFDGNKVVSEKEYMEHCTYDIKEHMSKLECRKHFRRADRDMNGQLTRTEFASQKNHEVPFSKGEL